MRVHLNHALEIKEVYQEDAGLYTVALRNTAAALERRLNITLVVNGEYCFSLNQIKSGGVEKKNKTDSLTTSPLLQCLHRFTKRKWPSPPVRIPVGAARL